MEQKKQSLKMKEINHNLTAKKIKERNEQFVKNEIDKYLEKNKNLLNASHTEEKLIPKKQSNKDRKIQKLNNYIIIQQKYSKKIWRCLTYLKIMMKINCRKFLYLSKMKRVLFGILPEKELNNYEKRYEIIEKEKDYLYRQFIVENKNLEKENKNLENNMSIIIIN